METEARYWDPALPVEERVEDLLGRMTLEEKLAQLTGNGVMAGEFRDIHAELPHGCGHINGTFLKGEENAEARAKSIERIQRYLVEETRLGIPALFHMEAVSGSFYPDAVAVPVAIAMGASFDPATMEELGDLIGRQNRAEGYAHAFGPVLELGREQRWGRLGETYGEDPTLAGVMAAAYIRGLQGNGAPDTHVGATGKHFLGYGMAENGRNIGNQRIPSRELQEVHMKPWAAAIEAGLSTVMNAYGVINGEPVVSSHEILTRLLRRELGFQGLTVADYCSVDRLVEDYRTAESITDAGVQALEAGLDVELPDPHAFGPELLARIRQGTVSEARIDDAVRHVLTLKFRLGLFERPYPDNQAIARIREEVRNSDLPKRLAQESMVLTKNSGVLPLEQGCRVAVIGPNGDSRRCFFGGYTYPAMLEMKANMAKMFVGMEGIDGAVEHSRRQEPMPELDIEAEIAWRYPEARSVLEAVAPLAGEVRYCQGCGLLDPDRSGIPDAVELAKWADIVLLALGGRGGWVEGCTSGEGIECPEIGLPGIQRELAEAICAAGTPVVVLHMDVRPMAEPKVTEQADAVMECWYAGPCGARSIAELLFGLQTPSGKLPLTALRGPTQNPTYFGQVRGCCHTADPFADQQRSPGPTGAQTQADPFAPLFYFGHGLSYTSFQYSDLALSTKAVTMDQSAEITLTVENVGDRPGDEVVQLYFQDLTASMVRPMGELAGFQRLHLRPGEKKRVHFTFRPDQTALINREDAWILEPGTIRLLAGASSRDIRLTDTLVITGQTRQISCRRSLYSPSYVTEE